MSENSILLSSGVCTLSGGEKPLPSFPRLEQWICDGCGYRPLMNESLMGRTASETEPAGWNCPTCKEWTEYK